MDKNHGTQKPNESTI